MYLMHGDAHQPGAETWRVSQLRQIAKRRHEGILHYILGLDGA
jgi:hypothetical protein